MDKARVFKYADPNLIKDFQTTPDKTDKSDFGSFVGSFDVDNHWKDGARIAISACLLTVSELADTLKVSRNTVYYWLSIHHDFPAYRAGKHLRFRLNDVLNYWASVDPRKACCNSAPALSKGRSNSSLKTENLGVSRAGLKKGTRHGN